MLRLARFPRGQKTREDLRNHDNFEQWSIIKEKTTTNDSIESNETWKRFEINVCVRTAPQFNLIRNIATKFQTESKKPLEK